VGTETAIDGCPTLSPQAFGTVDLGSMASIRDPGFGSLLPAARFVLIQFVYAAGRDAALTALHHTGFRRLITRFSAVQQRLRAWLRRRKQALPDSGGGGYPIYLDFPIDSEPRYGWGKPPHPQIQAILEAGRARYAAQLERILACSKDLLSIPREPSADGLKPFWNNHSLPALDGAALYGLMLEARPSRYMEVGIGNSTRFARYAITRHSLPTRVTAIDPYADPIVHPLCDKIIETPLEKVGLELFEELEAGDILFIDNSHRVFMNSDATVVFMDILPRLKPGVLVQIHDIAWPADYPPHWVGRYYSEQYLLGAYLLAGTDRFEVLLPCAFVSFDDELKAIMSPLWADPRFDGVQTHGASFWLRMT
jgi:hypothetical protein